MDTKFYSPSLANASFGNPKMVSSFFLTSNTFTSLSITTGLYNGAGRREVWSAQEVKAMSDDSVVWQ